MSLSLKAAPPESHRPKCGAELGMVVEALPRDIRGVLVREMNPAAWAAVAGVWSGDVIVKIDGQPVRSVPGAVAALKRAGLKSSLLSVRRDGQALDLTIAACPD